MNMLQRLDRIVYATGIDKILFRKVQPRSWRWVPLLVLASLLTGYVLMAGMTTKPSASFFAGWLLFYGAYLAAAMLRLFGPRFVPREGDPLDERELMVKARAYATSGIVITMLAMLGCCYMTTQDLPILWHPHTPNDWIGLAFAIQAVAMLLPTWIASWMQPPIAADVDD
jgi:hypothetical protein